MKILAKTLVLSSLLLSTPIIAGAGHDHGHDHGHSHVQIPVKQEVAESNAHNIIASLVERNKIDKNWSSINANSVEKKVFNGSTEWVVIFINDKIVDKEKQKLHVFLTVGGEYIAVNYTGN